MEDSCKSFSLTISLHETSVKLKKNKTNIASLAESGKEDVFMSESEEGFLKVLVDLPGRWGQAGKQGEGC